MSDHPEIAQRFARETAGHQMTVLHDEGFYRHLRFVNPDSSLYWYEITTTPGQLVFSGDGESFVFRLAPDMFEMSRRSAESGGINATYWAEKCRTGNAKSYSRERFEECVEKAVADAEPYYRGLREHVQEEIFDSELYDVDYESAALVAVLNFEHHLTARRDAKGNYDTFRFKRVHEWELRDFDWWFLFACYAVSDAIVQYDATICGSRCPKHQDHYCRRSPVHQPGICRDRKQKGTESYTWDPARKQVTA
ncbi:hypothetical protein [Streptomyces bugieae]|uniref:Uncharacterized protein n=1 Tax=Streptomyces bugieae TaxID=3098223 RepID=A0ABU7NL78_9ACTN|nr:hypothetical protein [Streptomyces sp. DSM 41528]